MRRGMPATFAADWQTASSGWSCTRVQEAFQRRNPLRKLLPGGSGACAGAEFGNDTNPCEQRVPFEQGPHHLTSAAKTTPLPRTLGTGLVRGTKWR